MERRGAKPEPTDAQGNHGPERAPRSRRTR